jgi:hypothetical protein
MPASSRRRSRACLLAKVFVCVKAPVAIVAETGQIQMTNPALDELLDYPPGGLVGKLAADVNAPGCRPSVAAARDRQVSDRQDYTMATRLLRGEDGHILRPEQIRRLLDPGSCVPFLRLLDPVTCVPFLADIDLPERFENGNTRRCRRVPVGIAAECRPVLARARRRSRLLLDFLAKSFELDLRSRGERSPDQVEARPIAGTPKSQCGLTPRWLSLFRGSVKRAVRRFGCQQVGYDQISLRWHPGEAQISPWAENPANVGSRRVHL